MRLEEFFYSQKVLCSTFWNSLTDRNIGVIVALLREEAKSFKSHLLLVCLKPNKLPP